MGNKVTIKKSQPTAREVHVDSVLTNISVAYLQDTADFIADQVFPLVPVNKKSDTYYVYDKQSWFLDEAERRAPSTESAGSGYRQSTETYNCEIYAFHKDLDNQTMSNYDNPLSPRRDSSELVSRKLLLKREKTFMESYLKTGVWGRDVDVSSDSDEWDDYDNSDPITFVTQERRKVKNATGFKPNGLLIGGEVWDVLKDHPAILDRVKYTREAIDINPQLVARAFDLDKLVIAEGLYSDAQEFADFDDRNDGDKIDLTPFVGKNGLLFYTPDSPSLLRPSAGYIFTWNQYTNNPYGMNVSAFYMDHIKSERIEGEMAYDQKVVGKDLGVFLENIVS